MRASIALKCLLAASLSPAVASQACLHFSDSEANQPQTIDPITARLLIAQRLGIAQYHELGETDAAGLQVVNSFGGIQQPLFDDKESRNQVVIIVDNVDQPRDILSLDQSCDLFMSDVPSSTVTQKLVVDLLNQDALRRSGTEARSCSIRFSGQQDIAGGINGLENTPAQCEALEMEIERPFRSLNLPLAQLPSHYSKIESPSTAVIHISALRELSLDHPDYSAKLREVIKFIRNHQYPSTDFTLLLLPPTTSITSNYGSYVSPRSPVKRQSTETREEIPLAAAAASSASSPASSSSSPAQNVSFPHGVMPTCHSSLEAANKATNNCSGHGHIYRKSTRRGRDGDKPIDCYACRCGSTKLTAANGGIKTIYWGGPACQKKDISMPFFLLAGISILLISVVGWGIGLLASVGSEDLPSVIGAGVAGPRAQK